MQKNICFQNMNQNKYQNKTVIKKWLTAWKFDTKKKTEEACLMAVEEYIINNSNNDKRSMITLQQKSWELQISQWWYLGFVLSFQQFLYFELWQT